MKNDNGKMYRQFCEVLDDKDVSRHLIALNDERLFGDNEIAKELAYRDAVIKRQLDIIKDLRAKLEDR